MTPTLAQALQLSNLYNVHHLRHELEQLQPGQPRAQAYDTDRTTSGQGPADPTFAAATNPSTAAADLAAYDRMVDQLYRACMGLAHLADRHVPTHEPRRADVLRDTKGCTWHQQAGVDTHQPVWRTTDAGFLNDPVPLCRPCWDYAHAHGERPTNEQIIRHSKGKGWTVRTTGKRDRAFTAKQIADEWNGAA